MQSNNGQCLDFDLMPAFLKANNSPVLEERYSSEEEASPMAAPRFTWYQHQRSRAYLHPLGIPEVAIEELEVEEQLTT